MPARNAHLEYAASRRLLAGLGTARLLAWARSPQPTHGDERRRAAARCQISYGRQHRSRAANKICF